MSADLLAHALATLEVARTSTASPTEARSGAGVYHVRTSTGRPAYLKVTPATLGRAVMAGAERELRFYRQVAPSLPVATPALLGTVSAPDGLALLLADAGTERAPTAWTDGDWALLGRALARIHATPVPDGEWARPDTLLTAVETPDLDRIRAFWAPVLPRLESLLEQRTETIDQLTSQPTAFVHGDCHAANIVHGERGPVFCDWQSTGLGRASADLAFLSVRATPTGAEVSPALVETYLAHRPQPVDPDCLKRAVLLEELAVYVFEWPAFAAYNDATGVARVRRRAADLADRLG
ncbi:phosphotransferase family protein [Promicromonospora sp. MS192]|uniref:phosphotransferase family protein n=1 Tax=Promicromonospora sp. MS192 TaxID=3412684 RepID=UPI003C2B2743